MYAAVSGLENSALFLLRASTHYYIHITPHAMGPDANCKTHTKHPHTLLQWHIHTHAHIHTHVHTHTYTYTHTNTHKHTHTHTHTHTNTYKHI